MRQIFHKIQLIRACFKVIKDPRETEALLKISDKFVNPITFEVVLNKLKQDENFRKLLSERYMEKLPTMEELAKFPKRTLGNAYYELLNSGNYKPDFFHKFDTTSEMNYVRMRNRLTHDLWHVLVGFDTSVNGEAGLQIFTFWQQQNSTSVFFAALVMLHIVFFRPSETISLWKEMVRGYEVANKTKNLLGFRWSELLSENLDNVKAMIRL